MARHLLPPPNVFSASLGDRITLNQLVAGSSPATPTKRSSTFSRLVLRGSHGSRAFCRSSTTFWALRCLLRR